jgi:2-polyprenyl-6-methoxyphenol hydroxylase-like FAD-dependent oxidoreductase
VLVVGAGPVGLAVAASLVEHGHDTAVVDRQVAGANTSVAAVVHARTLEMLEGIGVSERLAELGIHARFSIRDGDRELVPVPFDKLPTNYPYALMVPQNLTEKVLLERLEKLGGRVHRPSLTTGLRQTAGGVEVTLDRGEVVKAAYVIAADGMDSTIRELVGLGDDGHGTLPDSFALADVRVEAGLPADQVVLFFSTRGILVVAPLPDGSFRLVADVDDAPEQPDIRFTQKLLDARGPGHEVKVTDVIWGSRFRIHERVAQRYRAGRVVLAGDAAQTHSPAGGQGMNLGLREAISLGDALSSRCGRAARTSSTSGRPPTVPRHCGWSRSPTGLRDSRLPRRLFGRFATWRCASSPACRRSGEAWPSSSLPSAPGDTAAIKAGGRARRAPHTGGWFGRPARGTNAEAGRSVQGGDRPV